MSCKKPFLTLFLLYLLSTAAGQEGELQYYQNGFYIKQFSEIAGLVRNSCKNLYEDSQGFLWISTFNGLSRFDGKQFVNYNIKDGLPGSNITQISEDSSGFIYVATTTGIARYTGYNKSAETWFYTYPQTTHLAGYISGMQAVDTNTIIFQKTDGAVYLFKQNKITELTPPAAGSGNIINRNGNRYFYASIPDTMRVFNARFENVKNIFWKESPYSTVSRDSFGSLHIYSQGKKQRIEDDTIVYESQVPDSITWFASTDTLNAMFYERAGIIYSFDGRTSTPVLNMKTLSITCNVLMQAKDGSVWATSSAAGLFRIKALPYVNKEAGNAVCYYFQNGKKIIYINDMPFKENAVFIRARDSLKQITSSILIDNKGIAWFCTEKGLYKQPASGPGRFYIFPGDKSSWNERSNKISHAIELSNGDIWFYGHCGAILYKNDTFKHYTPRNGIITHGGFIRSMAADKGGNLLLVDNPHKLYYMAGDTVLAVTSAAGIGFSANTLTTDNRGYTWIEYNKKIFRLEKMRDGKFAVTDSLIPSDINVEEIRTFEFDLQGNCWVGYAGGNLQVFFLNSDGHYDNANSVMYTKDDGLSQLGLFHYTLNPDDSGNMLAILAKKGAGGSLSFSLQNVVKRKQLEAPAVNIVSIVINHKKTDYFFSGNMTGRNNVAASLVLPYDENNIIFNYNSSSLSNPSNITYKTMLKGFDKEWQFTNSTSAGYTNLPAGTYTFLVQAANVNGTLGPVFQYQFIIQPPWYKTWWAILLWIVLGILIIYLIFFIRLNSIRISHLKESSVFKSDLIGLIGHDMVTPLLYIAKVSRQLRNYNDKLSRETTLESLGEIDTTATKLHFFGESIVHWIKVQNNDFKPVVEKFQVNKTINELVDFHHPLAAEKRNEINYEMQGDLFCYQDPTLVRIILHNLLLNANKFTVKGKINIAAIKENDRLIITIQDTGKGMDESKVNLLNRLRPIRSTPGTNKEKGWGMGYKVITEMLKFTGGVLMVNSRLNEGTEVIINLPCRKNPLVSNAYSEVPDDVDRVGS